MTTPDLLQNAKNEFSAYATRFGGLYEALYQTAHGEKKYERVIKQWEFKPKKLDLRHNLELWDKLAAESTADPARHAQKIMGVLQSWGITRGKESSHIVSGETASLHYNLLNEAQDTLLIGDKLHIGKPSWSWDNTVLERGIASKEPLGPTVNLFPDKVFPLPNSLRSAAQNIPGEASATRTLGQFTTAVTQAESKGGMGKGGKAAIIGGGVALVAAIGGWVWHVKHRKEAAPEREQVATR